MGMQICWMAWKMPNYPAEPWRAKCSTREAVYPQVSSTTGDFGSIGSAPVFLDHRGRAVVDASSLSCMADHTGNKDPDQIDGSLSGALNVNHPSAVLWGAAEGQDSCEVDIATAELMSLCRAAPLGAARRVEHLLSIGATHPWKHVNGDTALHLATASGNTELVALLLHAGANINARTSRGQTSVHLAVQTSNAAVLLQLIVYGSKHGKALHRQVDVCAKDSLDMTPLHLAAFVGHHACCQILLDAGATTMCRDCGGRIPLHHCTSPNVAALLVAAAPESVSLADVCGFLPAHYAVMRNSFEILACLVQQQGATGVDAHGMQPLHYAVMWDCSDSIVDRMCTACDVNAADHAGLTALDYCIHKGDDMRAELMVKNGARMDPVLLLQKRCKRLTGDKRSPCTMEAVAISKADQANMTCLELLTQHERIMGAFAKAITGPETPDIGNTSTPGQC
eukprot:jgi/Ulvmu1/4656/UM002_0387.1